MASVERREGWVVGGSLGGCGCVGVRVWIGGHLERWVGDESWVGRDVGDGRLREDLKR